MGRRLKDWISAYLYYTKDTEPRESYRRWVAISTIAAVLERKCWTMLGDMEIFYPNLFIVLVGPPAARKGTAMRPARQMLTDIGITLASEETSRQKLVVKLQESGATYMMEGGVYHHSSITIFSSELAHFIGYQNNELLTMLNKLFDCEKLDKDTIGRGTEGAENTWGNLLGAITPALLMSCIPKDFVGSGFTSRTVFVYEENKQGVVVFPTLNERQREFREALRIDLERIYQLRGEFRWSEGAARLYEEWRFKMDNNVPGNERMLEGYADRRPTHLCKVMMCLSASRGDDMIISEEDAGLGMSILEETEVKMPLVFRGLGGQKYGPVQARLLGLLEIRKRMALSQVMQVFGNEVTRQEMGEVLETLESMGLAKIKVDPKTAQHFLVYTGPDTKQVLPASHGEGEE